MKPDLLNVLVVSGGSFQGLTVIKGLRASNAIRTCVVDSSEENIGKYLADSFFLVPEAKHEKKFIEALLSICENENIRLVIPSTDIELHALSLHKKVFHNKGIFVAVFNSKILDNVRNKRLLYDLLLQNNLPVLPVVELGANNLDFPLLGKPVYGWGGKNTILVNKPEDLENYNKILLEKHYIWQPYLKNFIEFSIDCAIGFDGTISPLIARQRLRTSGGFSVISESVQDPYIINIAQELLHLLRNEGAQGIINIQILKKDTDYFVSDINPRIGTSAVFAHGAGANLPLFLCSYFNPEIYTSFYNSNIKNDIKMIRYLDEVWINKIDRENISGIVFDLDDTLINQKAWIIDKLELLWSEYNNSLPEKSIFLLKALSIIEEGNRSRLFDALAKEFNLSEDFKIELIDEYRNIIPQNCPLFSDVMQSLQELKKMDLHLALLTDNPPQSQKQKIKVCHFDEVFDIIVYSRELNYEKPSYSVFEEVSKQLNIPLHSLLMAGDNLYKDIIGSLEAGFKYAYWVVRDGTFFNFDLNLLKRLSNKPYNFSKITNLKHIIWSLSKSVS